MKWQLPYGALFLFLLTPSCTHSTWKRAKSGLRYRIVGRMPDDSIARRGQTVKLEVTQKVGDSVMETTQGKIPLYFTVNPGTQHYNPLEVFDYSIHKGDSIITEQLVDSMLKKKIFKDIPKWMKPADEWCTYLKVVDIFSDEESVEADKAWELTKVVAVQTALGQARIRSWLDSHDKNASRLKDVFLVITRHGTGPEADSGRTVSLNFEMKTLTGKLVNVPTDTASHRAGPRTFVIGNGTLPPVLEKQVERMKEGEKADIYLPAAELFGLRMPENLSLTDDIVFSIDLFKVF